MGEQEVIRQMKNLVSRYDGIGENQFSVNMNVEETSAHTAEQEQFFQLMTTLAPSLRSQTQNQLRLRELARMADMDVEPMVRLLSANVSKDSYELALRLHLDKACDLLIHSEKPIEKIASECRFATPNFFVASFLRVYKVTPLEYRLAEK